MAQISNRVRQQYADAVQLLKEHGVRASCLSSLIFL